MERSEVRHAGESVPGTADRVPIQRVYDHSTTYRSASRLVVATIEFCRYDKQLEDEKKCKEAKYGTPGNRSPEQQTACRSSVCMTTKQPTAPSSS